MVDWGDFGSSDKSPPPKPTSRSTTTTRGGWLPKLSGTIEPPNRSLLGQFGHVVSQMPAGLANLGISAGREAIESGTLPVSYDFDTRQAGIGFGPLRYQVTGVPQGGNRFDAGYLGDAKRAYDDSREGGEGIERSLQAAAGAATADAPFSAPFGQSALNTGGRLANPSRYAQAVEDGTIVATLIEDAGNISMVGAPVAKAFTRSAAQAAARESAAQAAAKTAAERAASAAKEAAARDAVVKMAWSPAAAADAAKARTAAAAAAEEATTTAAAAEAAAAASRQAARRAASVNLGYDLVNRAGMSPVAAPMGAAKLAGKAAGKAAPPVARAAEAGLGRIAATSIGKIGQRAAETPTDPSLPNVEARPGVGEWAANRAGRVTRWLEDAPRRAEEKQAFRAGIADRAADQAAVGRERIGTHAQEALDAIDAKAGSPRERAATLLTSTGDMAILEKVAKYAERVRKADPDGAEAAIDNVLENLARTAYDGTGADARTLRYALDVIEGKDPEFAANLGKFRDKLDETLAPRDEQFSEAVGELRGRVEDFQGPEPGTPEWDAYVEWQRSGTTPYEPAIAKVADRTQRAIDEVAERRDTLVEQLNRLRSREKLTPAERADLEAAFGATRAALLEHATRLIEDRGVNVLRAVKDSRLNNILDRMESGALDYADGMLRVADHLAMLRGRLGKKNTPPALEALFDGMREEGYGALPKTRLTTVNRAMDAAEQKGAASAEVRAALREVGATQRVVDRLDATAAERIAARVEKGRAGLAREVAKAKARLEKAWAKETPAKRDPTGKTPSKAYRMGAADAAKATRIIEAHKAALRAYKVKRAELMKLDLTAVERITAQVQREYDAVRSQLDAANAKAAKAEARLAGARERATSEAAKMRVTLEAVATREGITHGQLTQRIHDTLTKIGAADRKLAKLTEDQVTALARAADDVQNAPSRYREVLVRGRVARQALEEMAEDADLPDVHREALLDLAPDIVTTLIDAVDAGMDPRYIPGGRDPKTVRSPLDLGDGTTGVQVGGKGMIETTPQLPAARKTTFRRAGASSDVGVGQIAARSEAAFRQALENHIAKQVADRFGRTARQLLEEQWESLGRWDDYESFRAELDEWETGARPAEVEALLNDLGYTSWDPVTGTEKSAARAKDFDTIALPTHLLREFRRYNKELKTNWFIKGFDTGTRWWKNFALALSPRWHVNNLFGNTIMATVGGADMATWPAYLARAKRLLSDDPAVRAKALREMGDNARYLLEGEYARPEVLGRGYGTLDLAKNFEEKAATPGVKGWLRHPIAKSYRLNGMVDDLNRTALFLQNIDRVTEPQIASWLKKNPWAKELPRDEVVITMATHDALRILGDFRKMSHFERNFIKRVFPFYPWMKHIVKLSADVAWNNPARALLVLHLGDMFGEDYDGPVPWLEGAIPMGGAGEDGRPRYWMRPSAAINPFADVMGTVGVDEDRPFPLGLLGAVNPAIKAPVALATGFDIGRLEPVSRSKGTGWVSNTGDPLPVTPLLRYPGQAAYYLSNLSPQATAIRKIQEGAANDGKRYLRYGTGQPYLKGKKGERERIETGQSPYPWWVNPLLQYAGLPPTEAIPENELKGVYQYRWDRWNADKERSRANR